MCVLIKRVRDMGAQNGKEADKGLDARDIEFLARQQQQQHLTRDQIHCQPRVAGIKHQQTPQPGSRGSRDKSRDSECLVSSFSFLPIGSCCLFCLMRLLFTPSQSPDNDLVCIRIVVVYLFIVLTRVNGCHSFIHSTRLTLIHILTHKQIYITPNS